MISFHEIANRFEKDHSGSALGPFLDRPSAVSGRMVRVSWKDLNYLSRTFQEDAGAWMVCQMTKEFPTAVLYGEWDWHSDFMYVGNRPLTRAEARLFKTGMIQAAFADTIDSPWSALDGVLLWTILSRGSMPAGVIW